MLAGGNREAVAVAQAARLQFVRAEGFVFSHVADEGWLDGCAGPLLRSSVLLSHWSSSNEARLSLVESFRVLLAPAELCHKEPRGLWMPKLVFLWQKIAGVVTL